MTNSETTSSPQPTPDDARFAFANVVESLGELIDTVEAKEPSVLGDATPCPEFTVEILLDHIVMVMRRVAAIGSGGHFSDVDMESLGSDWSKAYRESAHNIMEAWMDAAKLEQMFEVPWGQFPGEPILHSYTGELAVHGWDLATATGSDFTIPDDYLRGAAVAVKFIPAEGRETPEMPFSPVVDPGEGAPLLLEIAGWLGRQVNDTPSVA